MTVADYDALISEAKKEIGYCRQMIPLINDINNNLSNCIKDLSSVVSSLKAGLIIDGVPQGSTIEEKTNVIKPSSDLLSGSIPLIEARIKELEGNIVEWERAKSSLLVRLASLFKKKSSKNKDINDK